ncbi:MAG: glycosyltransferase family 4 protein [Dysgonomonas sp.]|nr:glycosyltransferase family 4 protein [Dysgonomonas sp.]
MKIVYCADNLNNLGGIERVTTIKASALAAIPGNEVYIITVEGGGLSLFPLAPKVKMIHLDVPYYSIDWSTKWNLIKGMIAKRKEHKKKLKKVLNDIKADVVISTGSFDKFFLTSIIPKGSIVIREIHFCRQYRHFHNKGWLETLTSSIGEFIDYKIKIKGYDQIYLLTEEDRLSWKNNSKVSVMPNPNSFTPLKAVPEKSKKVIAVGRYTIAKRFDNLLIIWDKITRQFPEWHLEIWGEGDERKKLENLIKKLSIEKTTSLKGYTSNIEEHLSTGSLLAFTSDYEGFGMVLIEAMAFGLPCVAFDCPHGPKDIITDGKDGFLIPPNNLDLFAEKLAFLMKNDQSRAEMAQNAIKRVDDYVPDKIARRWMDEFKRLKYTKQEMRNSHLTT